jgi:predicted ATPase
MGTDDEFAMPAGTVSVLVALPGDPRSSAGSGSGAPVAGGPPTPIGDAVAAAAASCGGLRLAGGPHAAAVFARAGDAVTCALMIQRGLTSAAVPARVAVHTARSGRSGPAYRGQVFDRCAALSQVACAGQVLLSQASASLVADDLPAGAGLTGLGLHRLGDLRPAERVWQLRHADLPAEFPPLRSLDAHPHNLPVELTSFVPRDAELGEIDRLTEDARLVTVTGSGGCGKTRLALHAAAGRIGKYPSGVWLAELAALRDTARVPATIAEALRLRRRGPDWEPADLAAAIGTGELLLVLDNCEHLVRSCAEVTDGLLRACPELRILATSREPLGVPGEVTWRVPSLSFPPGPLTVVAEEADRFEAVRLFAERARQARPLFTLTPENAAAVTEICARLNGIPLAIELAAARARVFSPAQIAAGLDNRFRLLAGGARTAVPRQQTLEASVAWSYELLTGAEQAMLRQLSVFAGGFTLEAADAVTTGPEPAVTLVSQLADKSLIIPAEDGSDDRFRMLETIRDYAANRLAEAGEAEGAQTLHFEYVRSLVDRRHGEDEDAYCARLRGEYDNIRGALSWAARQDSPEPLLDVTSRLVVFWSASTHLAEAVQWLRTATDRGHDSAPGLRARALGGLTQIASLALDLPVAFAAGTEGLALQRQLGDQTGIIMTLTSLGSSATLMGEPEAGRPYLHEAIALAEQAWGPARPGLRARRSRPGGGQLAGRQGRRPRRAAAKHRGGQAVRCPPRGRHRPRRARRPGRPGR